MHNPDHYRFPRSSRDSPQRSFDAFSGTYSSRFHFARLLASIVGWAFAFAVMLSLLALPAAWRWFAELVAGWAS